VENIRKIENGKGKKTIKKNSLGTKKYSEMKEERKQEFFEYLGYPNRKDEMMNYMTSCGVS